MIGRQNTGDRGKCILTVILVIYYCTFGVFHLFLHYFILIDIANLEFQKNSTHNEVRFGSPKLI